MARSRQRRKQRQQDREEAPANGGVAPELQAEADEHPVPLVEPPTEDFPTEIEGEFAPDVLIAAIGPLRRTRRHSLLPGIRMFTAMLEEARGGYAADRLEQMEHALGVDFNPLEREGILQIAMAEMDEAGVPDVEHGVQRALEVRGELGVDLGPDVVTESAAELDDEDFAGTPEDGPINAYAPQTEEGRRLAESGASDEDVAAMDEQVLERQREEAAVAAEEGEEEDHDAPGPDEA